MTSRYRLSCFSERDQQEIFRGRRKRAHLHRASQSNVKWSYMSRSICELRMDLYRCHRFFKINVSIRLNSRVKSFQNGVNYSRFCRAKSTLSPKLPLEPLGISVVEDNSSVRDFLDGVISEQEDAFFAVDLGRLIRLYKQWRNLLPRVDAFYAVKCNSDPGLLYVLAQLGAGFDCASKEEIRSILDLGVIPERIIYAQPAKQLSHLKFAVESGVHKSTFDSEEELIKVANADPKAEQVLRIRADDDDAGVTLGSKFGATLSEAHHLLDIAQQMGVNVIGVSFHIGYNSTSPAAYSKAIEMAHNVFEYGKSIGNNFTLLDMGGGFPGHFGSEGIFEEHVTAINSSLLKYFNDEKITVIAEPGTYFGMSPFTLAVCVTSKRQVTDSGSKVQKWMYYINDGTYGSFRLYNEYFPRSDVCLMSSTDSRPVTKATVCGSTCCSTDVVFSDISLPELNIGEWMYLENMGAYTGSVCSNFNGFPTPRSLYYISQSDAAELVKYIPEFKGNTSTESVATEIVD